MTSPKALLPIKAQLMDDEEWSASGAALTAANAFSGGGGGSGLSSIYDQYDDTVAAPTAIVVTGLHPEVADVYVVEPSPGVAEIQVDGKAPDQSNWPTTDEKAALGAAPTPLTAGNPVASVADVEEIAPPLTVGGPNSGVPLILDHVTEIQLNDGTAIRSQLLDGSGITPGMVGIAFHVVPADHVDDGSTVDQLRDALIAAGLMAVS